MRVGWILIFVWVILRSQQARRQDRSQPVGVPTGPVFVALLASYLIVAGPAPPAALAQSPVSLELALAVDISASIDDQEFRLIMRGMANAFRDPEIIELISLRKGVAVTLFQWSSAADPASVISWQLLRDRSSILAFAERIETAVRSRNDGLTAMGEAVNFALDLMQSNGFAGSQRKIDISGDGKSNAGHPMIEARQRASALGITINGLPIVSGSDLRKAGLAKYYREKVILGPGAFVEIADDFEDFERAFRNKLRRELFLKVSRRNEPPAGRRRDLAETQRVSNHRFPAPHSFPNN